MSNANSPSRGGAIYTLAQNDSAKNGKAPVILKGSGTDLSDPNLLQGKAKRKLISQSMALQLIDIAKEKRNKEMEQVFWNVYHCYSNVFEENNRSYGDYCKSHICPVCAANKKAVMIKQYSPIVSSWPDPHFVTLTSRAVPAKHLKRNIDGCIRAISKIVKNQRQRTNRGKGEYYVGIRSLECNFNPVKRTYNPHIHLLVPDKATAEAMREDWLEMWTNAYTSFKGQDIRKVRDTEKDLIEIVKYSSKVFTDPEMKKGKARRQPPKIYLRALYNIHEVMHGRRLLQNFGFKLPKVDSHADEAKVSYAATKYTYTMKGRCWIETATGTPLFDVDDEPMVDYLLQNNLDKNFE